MLISEVCKKCSLTKKAVEYYMEQGLIAPAVCENGYRDFSEKEVSTLQRISVLRNLGVSVGDIRNIITNTKKDALSEVFNRKALQVTVLQEKQELISELVRKEDWTEMAKKLRQLQAKESVLERILGAFPGNYGRYVCLHFAAFLKEPVETEAQKRAFEEVISFLDGVNFRLPDNLQEYFDEATAHFDEAFAENVLIQMENVNQDTEKYLTDNREFIENWIAYKQSEAYKSSPAYRLEEALRQFTSTSGYNEIFIPAMCRLSKSYREYYEAMQKANEKILQRYPFYPY